MAIKIHPRLLALINPRVLEEVEVRIAEAERAEAENPQLYRRYLEAHADHIMDELRRRRSQKLS